MVHDHLKYALPGCCTYLEVDLNPCTRASCPGLSELRLQGVVEGPPATRTSRDFEYLHRQTRPSDSPLPATLGIRIARTFS